MGAQVRKALSGQTVFSAADIRASAPKWQNWGQDCVYAGSGIRIDTPPAVHDMVMHNLFVRLRILCELILLRSVGFDGAELRRQIEATHRLDRRLVR